MKTLTSIFSTLVSAVLFFSTLIFNGLPVAKVPVNPEQYDDTVMFVSDYQSSFNNLEMLDRESGFSEILNAVDGITPGLIVGGGDYQSTFIGTPGTAFGVYSLRKAVEKKWDNDIQYLLCQGNHDAPKSVCLNDTGLYELDKYSVYLINEDDYPWGQSDSRKAEDTVAATASKLDEALTALSSKDENKPVFIVTHLPLHFTRRSNNGDNLYAGLLYDVIDRHSQQLNIVYLFGHNHSDTYDDYIGGAVNYLGKGESIQLGGSNETKILNFTYTNCGYIGYSKNSNSEGSTDTLTVTFITVNENELLIRKYSKDGLLSETSVDALPLVLDAVA